MPRVHHGALELIRPGRQLVGERERLIRHRGHGPQLVDDRVELAPQPARELAGVGQSLPGLASVLRNSSRTSASSLPAQPFAQRYAALRMASAAPCW